MDSSTLQLKVGFQVNYIPRIASSLGKVAALAIQGASGGTRQTPIKTLLTYGINVAFVGPMKQKLLFHLLAGTCSLHHPFLQPATFVSPINIFVTSLMYICCISQQDGATTVLLLQHLLEVTSAPLSGSL